jgi:MFS family permease
MNPGDFDKYLNYRYDKRLARYFVWNQVPSLVMMLLGPSLVGIITGVWWPLVAILVGTFALWGLGVETRLLCSHCPFYAAEGKTLHCLALDGFPKFWKYRPGPMSQWEKYLLSALVIFLMVGPVLVELYGTWYLWTNSFDQAAVLGMLLVALATILTEWQFTYVIGHDFCSRCINFSCPLNRVPKPIVDNYIKQNPMMQQAWEKEGYSVKGRNP